MSSGIGLISLDKLWLCFPSYGFL